MKKRIAIIIILLLLAAAGVFAYFFFFRGKTVSPGEKVYVQSVASLQTYGGYGNRFSGVVEAQKSDKVELSSDRKLKEVFVAEGDHVAVGDPLFCYDTEQIVLEIDQLNLEIERLNNTIANDNSQIAQLSNDMQKVAEDNRYEYTATIAQLQADIAQCQYDIKSKQADIQKKQSSIENSTVFAKMEGTVKSIAEPDAILSGTSFDVNGNPDTTFITILADGDFRIRGRISESNIYEIYTGEAMIARSRINDQVWKGTISLIDTQSTAEENQGMYYSSGESASNYSFYVELESTDGLMLGQHVILEADLGEDLPSEGIWLDGGWLTEENGQFYVWAAAAEGKLLEKRSVTTGRHIEETNQYEITEGLKETEFLAWPDPSCYDGAPTTSEYIVPETENNAEYFENANE